MPQYKEDQLIAEAYTKKVADNKQLKMGIKAELSDKHTKSKKKAEKIAKDHLKEDPKYYSKLKKCKL
jgi:hypothetical protein